MRAKSFSYTSYMRHSGAQGFFWQYSSKFDCVFTDFIICSSHFLSNLQINQLYSLIMTWLQGVKRCQGIGHPAGGHVPMLFAIQKVNVRADLVHYSFLYHLEQ